MSRSAGVVPLQSRRVVFFGGKGGVGKTTLAAAFALRLANDGHRTLLVSTDPAHSTGDVLETALDHEPRVVVTNLTAMEIDPEEETERYIARVKEKIAGSTPPRLVAEVERQIDIARVTPGAAESALFERFTTLIDEGRDDYDRIVFDTAPTGHTLRLLSLPETMSAWIGGLITRRRQVNLLGRMWRNVAGAAAGRGVQDYDPVLSALQDRQRRFARARRLVTDAHQTAFAFVVIPERLPIFETQKAVEALDKYHIPVGAVFVNRLLPTDAEGDFVERRRARETTYLDLIADAFAAHPRYHVPLLDADVVGLAALETIGGLMFRGT